MSMSVNSVEDDTSPLLSSYQPDDQTRAHISPRPSPDRRVSEGLLRQPINYHSINGGSSSYSSTDNETSAIVSRYKYYSRLAPHSESTFTMPDHVVPDMFMISTVVQRSFGSQPSWVTIFSLWNTMMGTSLLSMPWAINQAGFACGISLLIAMAGLMLYTSYRILDSVRGFKTDGEIIEFSDICRKYLGRWGEVLAFISSLLTLLGGMIVYWILITNFLYNIVTFIYHSANGEVAKANSTAPICPSSSSTSNSSLPHNRTLIVTHESLMVSHESSLLLPHESASFDKYWDQQKTVPFILIALVLPLINFKSPTFFTKFNVLGTVSVTYLVCFGLKNAISWGIHMDFHNTHSPAYVFQFKTTFPALTGVASLAYFGQNCVLSITRMQKHPENNVRDLIIAYCLVAITYVYMGVIIFISFNLNKDCLEDNFLNNLQATNVMAFIARIGLFIQMMCVFPLLVFIFRVQFMNSLFGSVWPSLKHILVLNICLIAVCIVFAVFLPHIGKIIGFVGAFCGFSYAILLPCLVYMKKCHLDNNLTIIKTLFHVTLIVLGLANFVGQFLLL